MPNIRLVFDEDEEEEKKGNNVEDDLSDLSEDPSSESSGHTVYSSVLSHFDSEEEQD